MRPEDDIKLAYVFSGMDHTPLLQYAKQMNIKYAVSGIGSRTYPGIQRWDYVPMRNVKQNLADFGLDWKVYEGPNDFLEGVKTGNKETRDYEIQALCTCMKNMHLLGVKTICYNWMPLYGWFRSRVNCPIPGGAVTTGFKMDDVKDAPPNGVTLSKDELWTNLEYFLKRVVPVAEEYEIELAVHPDDPPVAEGICGVERILTSADAMEEVTKIVPSEFNGITFCQGSFATMGEDIEASIRRFAKLNKLFFVHFRDVEGDRYDFTETFHHTGKTDMYKAMKTYYEVGYKGLMRPDHVPTMYGENNERPGYEPLGNLFATGYIMGLQEAAKKELGLE